MIGEALQALREKKQSSREATSNGAQREAVREMLAFVEKNRVRLQGVSCKGIDPRGPPSKSRIFSRIGGGTPSPPKGKRAVIGWFHAGQWTLVLTTALSLQTGEGRPATL